MLSKMTEFSSSKRFSRRLSIQEQWRRRVSNRASISMTEEMQMNSTNLDKKIQSFLATKDIAPWFRGTSIFHIQGCESLFNALRDDTEQSTSHRVRACLHQIGLQPMLNSKYIKMLMRLSRGNDLAFLWFLMELYYKTPKPGYSINEQLICTAIYHLDRVTTLRELDRILPKPIPRRKRKSSISTQQSPSRKQSTGQKLKSNKYILPYFCKQTLPKPYGKPLAIPVPNLKVTFGISKLYTDENYQVSNEMNRWYADYKMQTSKRIANRLLKEEIDKIFNNSVGNNLKPSTLESICDHHKRLQEIEEQFALEMRVKVRDTCLKYYFGDNQRDQQRVERIRKMLDKEIDLQLEKFHQQVVNVRKSMTLQTLTSQADLISIILGNEDDIANCAENPNKFNTKIDVGKDNDKSNSGEGERKLLQNSKSPNVTSMRNSLKSKPSIDYSSGIINRDSITMGKCLEKVEKFATVTKILGMTTVDDLNTKNTCHVQYVDNSKQSQMYFHCAKENQPYCFDYQKIFDFEEDKDCPTHIKQAALDALDFNIENLTHSNLMAVDCKEAVSQCVRSIWRNEVKDYMDKFGSALQLKSYENAENLYHKYPPGVYYNPKDTELMTNMLKDAFELMRKNPKFVWAQLPDAHKVPLLTEWIAARYGKTYTTKERLASFAFSLKIFHALDKMIITQSIPSQKQLCSKTFVDYKCRNYLKKKVDFMKKQFYNNMCEKIMEKSRIFWFAMRGYICSGGPPRPTYFAYMPSREQDILRFRLWRPDEFRNYKDAWDKRRMQKLRESH